MTGILPVYTILFWFQNITRESVVLLTSSLLAHCEQHFTSDFVFLIIVGHYLHISGADARHVPPEIQKYLTKYLLRFDKLNILACASSVSQFMERFVIVTKPAIVIMLGLVVGAPFENVQ